MTKAALHFSTPVLLVGAAPVEPEVLRTLLAMDLPVIAADGGADHLDALGVTPTALIGDLDSVQDVAGWRARGVAVHHIAEQDTTDFDKSLAMIDAPGILATGFTGGRLDHTLAVMTGLMREPAGSVIVVNETDIIARCPAKLDIGLEPGTRVSLYPLTPVRGRSEGLHWPLDGLVLEPTGLIGTSNRATGPVTIRLTEGDAVLILPRRTLPHLRKALGW